MNKISHSTVKYAYLSPLADTDSSSPAIEVIDNRVYFYADVTSENCLRLIRAIRETDSKLRTEQAGRRLDDYPLTPIWLHIHSYGGDLFAGLALPITSKW